MYFSARTASLALLSLMAAVVAQEYNLVKEYAGPSFFDDWSFYNNVDNLTHGNAFFVGDSQASSARLAFVNDAGNAVMRYGQNRNAIRISTKDQFTVGSVWVTDILHVPFGCSVWGAFWSSAPIWPLGGEAVNQDARSHMGLHTNPTSTLVNSTNCDINANGNQGCIVTNPDPASYGQAFANAGGGVYVTEFATSGISIWVFNRTTLPSSLQGNQSAIDTSTLGAPVANWPADGCDVTEFFQPQEIVFDITLCGDYAGAASIFQQTCSGVCYQDFVLGDPSHYDTAFFEVAYLRVYGQPGELTVIQTSGATARIAASRGSQALLLLVTVLAVGLLLSAGTP
ncbi:uncharacterized protein BXZ73DRAFT_89876 [Epithele typhae]|uniref:uncharacterized protein n=1 Tax=Epithele typhae TaxID=378194 RepID=UPI00200894E7|nr:uncharacterized protein BXZ73DRAFT_89876 [Epithele typhae]KAH9932701.1 hypothetical protein BXZ73DRAFT_89876 [Epithele typhae]